MSSAGGAVRGAAHALPLCWRRHCHRDCRLACRRAGERVNNTHRQTEMDRDRQTDSVAGAVLHFSTRKSLVLIVCISPRASACSDRQRLREREREGGDGSARAECGCMTERGCAGWEGDRPDPC
eukprot:3058688-Rhodomonas_salina.4